MADVGRTGGRWFTPRGRWILVGFAAGFSTAVQVVSEWATQGWWKALGLAGGFFVVYLAGQYRRQAAIERRLEAGESQVSSVYHAAILKRVDSTSFHREMVGYQDALRHARSVDA